MSALIKPTLNNRFRPAEQARLRLLCFPYAGGGASIFSSWLRQLPPYIAVQPVQLPGRETRLREEPLTSLPRLAESILTEIRPLLDMPFAFFGHSMGALLAFELSRMLRQRSGLEPAHLFISGRGAPQLPELEPPTYDLPETELLEKLRSLNGTPQEVLDNAELLQVVLPTLRADFKVCETYAYSDGHQLSCPMTVLGGLGDVDVPRERLEPWREHTSGPFTLRMFPGDHFYLHTAEQLLLQVLYRDLYQIEKALR
jgi:medium-chain acyl-[acyl-carrier-protein] hydrolase